MLNETHTPDNLRVVCSYPTTPAAGGVVIYGDLCGIAETDEDTTTGETVVRFGPWVGDLSVQDINTGGIAVGAPLFASKASPVVLSNLATGVFFGWANEVVSTGATATIEVIKAGYAGGILAASAIGSTQLAAGGVIESKLVPGAAGAGITGLVTKFVADANVIGGIPVVHRIAIADASANTDVLFTHKTKIIRAWFQNKGAAAHAANDTLRLINGTSTNYITAATAKTATVNAVIDFATLSETYDTIAAGGTLRVTAAKDTNVAAEVFILGIRVA
jgi:hypothetical protein